MYVSQIIAAKKQFSYVGMLLKYLLHIAPFIIFEDLLQDDTAKMETKLLTI